MSALARFVAPLLGAVMAIARPGDAIALNDITVTAESAGIAAGGDIKNNTINQTINQQDPAVLAATVRVLTDQNAATTEARVTAEREAATLAEKLKFTTEATIGFLQTLGEKNVTLEKIPAKLIEIATQAVEARQHLAALNTDNPDTRALVDQAKIELDKGHPDVASGLLQRAEEAELVAAAQARALAQQASSAADAQQLHAAEAREARGDVALTQLRYGEAAKHFEAAASLLPTSCAGDIELLLSRKANALYRQGDEFGDSAALIDAISILRRVLQRFPRESAARQWAATQMNLGIALARLGERESGTTQLEEAVATLQRGAGGRHARSRAARVGDTSNQSRQRLFGISWKDK